MTNFYPGLQKGDRRIIDGVEWVCSDPDMNHWVSGDTWRDEFCEGYMEGVQELIAEQSAEIRRLETLPPSKDVLDAISWRAYLKQRTVSNPDFQPVVAPERVAETCAQYAELYKQEHAMTEEARLACQAVAEACREYAAQYTTSTDNQPKDS